MSGKLNGKSRLSGWRAVLSMWLVVLCGVLAVAQDTTGVGSITGTVKGTDGRPAVGIKVCLVEPVRCAISGETGDFRINDLRTGSYQLEVIISGQPTLRSEEIEVRAGLESRIEVALPKLDAIQQSVTISIPSFIAPEEVKSSGYLVQPNEILKAAGALQDVSRYVQTLPGVVIGSITPGGQNQ